MIIPTILRETYPTAKKEHRCEFCCEKIVYINQLESLKRELIKAERYEDVEKISKCIEQEYGRLKRKIDDQSKNESNNRKEKI